MYYTNDNESLDQQLVKNNKSDYDCILEEVGFLLDVWHSMYKGKKIMFAAPFEMLIFLNDLVMDKNNNIAVMSNDEVLHPDILFDRRSLDYNKLVYFKMRALIDSERLEDAADFADEVKEINPCSADVIILQAYALLRQGELQEAFDLANIALDNSYEPRQAGFSYKIMADAMYQAKEYKVAKVYYLQSNAWVKDLCNSELNQIPEVIVENRDISVQLETDSADFPSKYMRMMTLETLQTAKEKNLIEILAHVALTFNQIFKDKNLEQYLKEHEEIILNEATILSREYLCDKMAVLL